MSDNPNEFPTTTSLLPTGKSGAASDLTIDAKLFLFKTGVVFASTTVAKLEATLDGYIQDEDVIPFPLFLDVESADTESIMYEGNTGQTKKVGDGSAIKHYNILSSLEEHSRFRSYDQFEGGFMIVDKNDNCKMSLDDAGVILKPLTIGSFSVGLFVEATDTVPAHTRITISQKYPKELNDSPGVFKPDYDGILGKNGLLAVRLATVGTPNATTIVVNASVVDSKAAVVGLEAVTDWSSLDADGVAQTISTAEESATIPGQYTLTGTFATGTLSLGLPSAMGVEGYKSAGQGVGLIAITIA